MNKGTVRCNESVYLKTDIIHLKSVLEHSFAFTKIQEGMELVVNVANSSLENSVEFCHLG